MTREPMSTAQVAIALGVSPERVRWWIRDAGLRATRKGKRYEITVAELTRFLASRNWSTAL